MRRQRGCAKTEGHVRKQRGLWGGRRGCEKTDVLVRRHGGGQEA